MPGNEVIVVGAGIGGLGAATGLARRGRRVRVLEAASHPGGRMQALERDGDRVDVGAQFFHSNYTSCLALIDASGLADQRRPIAGKTQYRLADGSSYEFDHNVRLMRLLGLRGHLELLAFAARYLLLGKRFPMYQIAREIPEYDHVMASEVIGPGRFRDYLARPVCWGETQCGLEDTTLYHFLHQLRLTIGTDFVGLAGGVSSLCDALAKPLDVRYEAPVRRLLFERGRVAGVELEDGSVERAAHVIVAVTPDAAARLLPPELEERCAFLATVDHVRISLPVFFLDRPLRRDVWSYFLDPAQEHGFAMAVDQTAKLPDMVPSGKAIVTAWPHYPGTETLMALPDDEVIRRALADLDLMIPGFAGFVEEARLVRHPFGTAWYTRGAYGRTLRFLQAAERLRGVSFVSSAFGGTHMEAALRTAERAVHRACADASQATTPGACADASQATTPGACADASQATTPGDGILPSPEREEEGVDAQR